jgi:hypothetical protein
MKSSAILASLLVLSPAVGQTQANVTIDVNQRLATIQPEALGLAVAVWDDHMNDPQVPRLIADAGFKVLRYPGGSYADIYHWQTHSVTKGQEATVRSDTGFDRFMEFAHRSGTTPLITVNYGSNEAGTGGADPKEAAAWVRYANRSKHYGVKYWEIGNEVYGNGFYNGQGWEEDLHAPDTHKSADRLKNPMLGPQEYGRNVAAFVDAMKREDRSVKVGAVLCCPRNWPDRVDPDWNSAVLRECGQKIDFVVVHWYGEGKSPAEILSRPLAIPSMVARLKQDIAENCGSHAPKVQIWMTEGDASGFNTRSPGDLFAADELPTWWESGATHVDWWNLHNGAVKTFDGTLDDQGILSNESSVDGMKEPPANTPFPPYFGVQLVSKLVEPGDQLIAIKSDKPTIRAHASLRQDGRIGLLLINEGSEPVSVAVNGEGTQFRGATTRFDYDPALGKLKETPVEGEPANLTVTIQPLSATVVLIRRS